MGRPPLDDRIILDAAIELFLEHGVSGTTMTDIADRAGITKRTLYKYFENKEEVFDGALVMIFEMLEDVGESLEVDPTKGLDDSLHALVRYFAELHMDATFLKLSKILVTEVVTGRIIDDAMNDRYTQFEDSVGDVLKELKKVYFKDSAKDLGELQQLLTVLLKGHFLYPQVIENKPITPAERGRRISEIVAVLKATL